MTQERRRLLDLLHDADGHAEVRFGAASAVCEGAAGLLVPWSVGNEPCPACGAEGPIAKFAPVGFESGKRGERQPLKKLEEERSAAEYDEATFSAFHLAELFRGAVGAPRLVAFLRALNLVDEGELIREVYAWPVVGDPSARATHLGRPALMVATDQRLISLVTLPMRSHPQSRIPAQRVAACRALTTLAAKRLGVSSSHLRFIIADGLDASSLQADERLRWGNVFGALRGIDVPGSRPQATGERWEMALRGDVLPSPIEAWPAVLEPKSRHNDYGFHVFPYRSQNTVNSHLKIRVCRACGFTTSDGRADAERRRENPSVLDLVAEVVEDWELAGDWLTALGCSVGTIERVMCWPRLAPAGTTPDIVFIGSEGVLVVEAKGVHAALKTNGATAREVLERAANAHQLRELAKPGGRPQVLILGSTNDAKRAADAMAGEAWKCFEANDDVPKWSRSSATTSKGPSALYAKSHSVTKSLRKAKQNGLRDMLVVHDYTTVADALSVAAAHRAEQRAVTDPQAAIAYRATARRAAGFMAFRSP